MKPTLAVLRTLVLLSIVPAYGLGQTKKTVSLADAPKWESLGQTVISPNGQWIAFQITRGSGENDLRFRKLTEDSTRIAKTADQPAFSRDGNWLAYRITVSETERTRLQKQNQPIRDKLGIIDLRTGTRTIVDDAQAFAFNYAGSHLVYRKYAPTGRKSRGADLVVRDLAAGTEMLFGNVAEYAWQDRGTLLGVLIDAETPAGNGVQLYDAATGTLRVLDSKPKIGRAHV